MLTKGILFHQDNAPVHESVVVMSAIHDCDFELTDHPPYSPDLVRQTFNLFPKIKKKLDGRHFLSNDDKEKFSCSIAGKSV